VAPDIMYILLHGGVLGRAGQSGAVAIEEKWLLGQGYLLIVDDHAAAGAMDARCSLGRTGESGGGCYGHKAVTR